MVGEEGPDLAGVAVLQAWLDIAIDIIGKGQRELKIQVVADRIIDIGCLEWQDGR